MISRLVVFVMPIAAMIGKLEIKKDNPIPPMNKNNALRANIKNGQVKRYSLKHLNTGRNELEIALGFALGIR
jgi:hypothetical protein